MSASRCFRSAAGTTITSRAIWTLYEACTKTQRVEPHPGRALAAQYVSARSVASNFGQGFARAAAPRCRLQWFDQLAEDERHPADSQPPVRIFVMGTNRWRDEGEWPPARAAMAQVLSRARPRTVGATNPDAHTRRRHVLSTIRANPVPTTGGAVCCNPRMFPWGPMDQRAVEKRRDVLVYTTAPLGRRSGGDGPVKVVLLCPRPAPRHRFHRQAGGRVSGRRRAQPHRRHTAQCGTANRWKSRS